MNRNDILALVAHALQKSGVEATTIFTQHGDVACVRVRVGKGVDVQTFYLDERSAL